MRKPLLAIALLGSFALSAGCVNQNQVDVMQARIRQQDQQIQQLNSQLSGVQPAQADTWAQVQSLRQEMGTVKGQIDDFNNATASVGGLAGLAQQLAKHEQILNAMQTQFGLEIQTDQPVTGATAAAGAVAGATTGATVAQAASTPSANTPTAQGQKDTATALYDAGIASFNVKNYQDALNAFKDFTNTYPKHRLASNAWFWQGESNFQLGRFPDAALNYEQVISKFPSSGKVASAYLKQGMSFIKTNKKDAAKFRLDELVKKFPKSAEATRAKQLLKTL